MLCRQKVADFEKWKQVFDSHAAAQSESGLQVQHVWRNIDNSHEVFMLFQVTDLTKAKAFVTSPDVPRAQEESGALEYPDIYFLT